MASWYGGGTPMSRSSSDSSLYEHRDNGSGVHVDGVKRRLYDSEFHSPLFEDWTAHQAKRVRYNRENADFRPVIQPAFFVIKEAGAPHALDSDPGYGPCHIGVEAHSKSADMRPHTQQISEQEFHPPPMKRTWTGLSISSDEAGYESPSDEPNMMDDGPAAALVESHFSLHCRRARDSKTERILRSLICPKSPAAEFEIDDAALQSIFYAANEVFFSGCLKGRVRWDWSNSSNAGHHGTVIGTTALRTASTGGYETLIVLSHPILMDKHYNRRLLISTFLHELIHSYLFVQCGVKARRHGGHTNGFHRIARLIDKWAGPDILFLSNMEADLRDFLAETDPPDHHVYSNCAMQCPGDMPGTRQAIPPCRWPTYV